MLPALFSSLLAVPRMTPNQAWAHARQYHAGVNLGGWLVIEPWCAAAPSRNSPLPHRSEVTRAWARV